MDTKSFLESVLAENGRYCITALRADRRAGMEHYFFDDLDAAVAKAASLDESERNVYFALATFSEFQRAAANAVALRSVFIDLDVSDGDARKYPSQAEALQALRTFCKDTTLPKPTIVNSGTGIHAYWPLEEQLSRLEWYALATRFKQFCVDRGLKIDPVVSADAARVLRVPGTHNYKTDPPREVYIVGDPAEPIQDLKAFLDLLVVDDQRLPPAVVAENPPFEHTTVTAALASNAENSFRRILERTAKGSGCNQLKRIVEEQATLDEPSWRAGLSIAVFCTDRDKSIHLISKSHPEYNEDETERKAAAIAGPYLCTKFEEINPGGCDGCPHLGELKSPIVLGREIVEADPDEVVLAPVGDPDADPETVLIPKYPPPYFRGKSGGVFKRETDENGDVSSSMVYHNDLYVVKRVHDPELGESAVVRLHLPKDGVREFTISLATITSTDDLRKALSVQGVGVTKVGEIMNYMTTWINSLQTQQAADKARRQFGWTDDKGTSFVVGGIEIFADRVASNPPSAATAQLFPYFEPHGTIDAWKEVMAFYNVPGMEIHQYMIGIGFGSVLLHMLPIHGAGFHIYSDGSGYGKTTGMYAGASIWGKPKKLVLTEKDTHNTKMLRAEIYRHLPLYIDELTAATPKDLSALAYHITDGEQRNRMSGKGNYERVRGEEWALICGSTGNRSIWESIAAVKRGTQAEMQRILEVPVHRVDLDKEKTDALTNKLRSNYGHAKVPYIQYICKHYDLVKSELEDVQRTIDRLADLGPQNRFWSAEVACVIMGLRIARRLKFVSFDMPKLVEWIVGVLKGAKIDVVQAKGTAIEALTLFYLENYNNILRVSSVVDNRVKSTSEILARNPPPEAEPRQRYVARYEYDTKLLFVVPAFFREWCSNKQIHYGGIFQELKKAPFNAGSVITRLGKGTNVNLPPMAVMRVSFDDSDAADQLVENAPDR